MPDTTPRTTPDTTPRTTTQPALDPRDVEDRLRQAIVAGPRWPGPEQELDADFPLIDSGVIDSMGLTELIVRIESMFAVTVEDDEILPEHFENLASIVRFVVAKRGG